MKAKKLVSLLVCMVMLFALTTSAFAASGTKSVTASGSMGLVLDGNKSGQSNIVTFNVSGLPTNAVVTKLELTTSSMSSVVTY
ncbi:hypothetical protein [Methylomusa anaerophila]|uniref:DUF4397 domain-containing protein n=1 Tax=Methylomusa anaerophila TaxID=1930071 RepID=A0A348AIH8_9FIRM|nr:hypothetical protein [Methylomusa anaerophila]BBB90876.1 hypothetical protein MAMMFC1_01543 [Methylomusa anaerophila]